MLHRTVDHLADPRHAPRQTRRDSVRAASARLPLRPLRPARAAGGVREPAADRDHVRRKPGTRPGLSRGPGVGHMPGWAGCRAPLRSSTATPFQSSRSILAAAQGCENGAIKTRSIGARVSSSGTCANRLQEFPSEIAPRPQFYLRRACRRMGPCNRPPLPTRHESPRVDRPKKTQTP